MEHRSVLRKRRSAQRAARAREPRKELDRPREVVGRIIDVEVAPKSTANALLLA